MTRLTVFALFLFLPLLAHAQGSFMFSGSDPGAAAPSAPPAAAENDDELISQIMKIAARKARTPERPPVSRPAPRPSAVSPNERSLQSPGRAVARGERLRPATPIRRGHTHGDGHDHSTDEGDDDTESVPSCPGGNCQTRRRAPAVRTIPAYGGRVMSTPRNMRTPIWAPFARNFEVCAPGCQPLQVGIHREPNGRMSCHHSARAIDVGAMVCGGRVYRAIDNGRFGQMVSCMRSRLKTLYRQSNRRHLGVTQAHYDHAHFSIGCYGGTFM